MKYSLLSLLLFFAATLSAQEKTNPTEVKPHPAYELGKYINEHLVYPENARKHNIEGKVLVKFVVNDDGSISNCSIAKGIDPDCDKEALHVVKNMPAWVPGQHEGKPANMVFTLPIIFTLADEHNPPKIFTYVEQMPVPAFDMNKYLAENIRYPKTALENNIEGRVIVKFIVTEDGTIDNATVIRGIGGGCDEEALRVMSEMPAWKPGKQNGKPVKVWFSQPITFRLETK